jgi:signal transduction histidine kinase
LQTTAAETVNSLRDLSRGVYPRLLARSGLVPALKAAAEICPVPVSVKADSFDGDAAEVDAAVYFCCLEALQNAVKHSRASHIDLELRREGGFLIASVQDDGIGFAGNFSPEGGGVANMRDRLEAVGGALAIESSPGTGSTVLARIPVSQNSVASTRDAAVSRSALNLDISR